jgi:hypothetical protein
MMDIHQCHGGCPSRRFPLSPGGREAGQGGSDLLYRIIKRYSGRREFTMVLKSHFFGKTEVSVFTRP